MPRNTDYLQYRFLSVLELVFRCHTIKKRKIVSAYLSSPLKPLDELDVPAYRPNHAAPAPTIIDIKPDCSSEG